MSWTRVDDKWHGHKKTRSLSLPARGVWVTVLSWAGMYAPDGCFTQDDLDDLFPRVKPAELQKLVGELLKVPEGCTSASWERTPTGYRIHDFTTYRAPERDKLTPEQRSKRARSAAQARWGGCSEDAREHDGSMQEECSRASEVHAHEQCGSMPPVPARPGPSRPDQQPPDPELPLGNPEYPEQIPADWQPESQDWAQAFVVAVAEPLRRALVRRFRSHHLDGELRTPTEWRRSFRNWAPRMLETRLTELQADVRAEEDAAIAAGKAEARQVEESEALAQHRAKRAEAARRAGLTQAQRDVEDALVSLRRAEYTLAHPGLPLSATAPARAAKRKAEATLAKHGVPIPGGAKRSA